MDCFTTRPALAKTLILPGIHLPETGHSTWDHSLPHLINYALPLIFFFPFFNQEAVFERTSNLEPSVVTANQVQAFWLCEGFTYEPLSQKEPQILLFLKLP